MRLAGSVRRLVQGGVRRGIRFTNHAGTRYIWRRRQHSERRWSSVSLSFAAVAGLRELDPCLYRGSGV